MRHLSHALALCLAASACFAQSSPVTTLRTDVRLTTVDVVVTDGKGHAVAGLKQDDFTIRERKQPQAVRNFEEHNGGNAQYDPPRPGVRASGTKAAAE